MNAILGTATPFKRIRISSRIESFPRLVRLTHTFGFDTIQPRTQCHPVEIKHLVSPYHACERRDPLSQSFGANRLAPVWRLEPINTIDMSWAGCSVNTAEMHAFPSGKKLFGASSDWRLVWRLFGASSVWRNRLAPVWRLWRKGLVWRLFGA